MKSTLSKGHLLSWRGNGGSRNNFREGALCKLKPLFFMLILAECLPEE